MRSAIRAVAVSGMLLAGPVEARAQGELITPSTTHTLADVSRVLGIQRTTIRVGGGATGSFVMNSDRQMTLTANNLTVDGREIEATTSFDDPNTLIVEGVPISALGTNGLFCVGLRDINATNGPGTAALFVDDVSGASDFVFLDGVDGSMRVWNVPLSLFGGVDTNQIKALAFVLLTGSMPNSPAVLNVHFRGHPFIPTLSSSSSGGLSALETVPAGITQAGMPVAISGLIAGGAVTSLVRSATNFVMGYSIPNSNSAVRVQIDRGTLDPVDVIWSGLDGGGLPQFSFAPLTGNLYAVDASTDLVQWASFLPTLSSTGVVAITNYGAGAANGFARIATRQFPYHNASNLLAFGMRGTAAGIRVLVELVDSNGIAAPHWINSLTTAFRYAITNDPATLPESFDMGAIDRIRISVPKTYKEYPSGTDKLNALSGAAIDFRLQGGIGPVSHARE